MESEIQQFSKDDVQEVSADSPVAPALDTVGAVSFAAVVLGLKAGFRYHRTGWNGKGMWIELQNPDISSKMSLPYIYMHTADFNLVPWLASQTDILAEDWYSYYG